MEELKIKLYCASEEDEDDEVEDDENDDEGGDREIAISFACEDCDYRWEIYVEDEDEDLDDTQFCPMCGSANTSQIWWQAGA